MFGLIVARELKEHLSGFRFGAVFALTQLLMVTSVLVFSAEREMAMAEYEAVANLVQSDGLVNLQGIPCKGGIRVTRRPGRLAFAAAAGERELPDGVRLAAHGLQAITHTSDPAELVASGAPVDWAYTIAVLLSFAAGLLTYRSVSSEREAGTLALALANSVSRGTVLAGKYGAAMVALVFSLLTGAVLSLLVLLVLGTVELQPGDWLQLGAIAVLALLYLSCFVLIGLVCSVVARNSTIAAVLFLGVWAVLVFVVPNVAGIAAPGLVEAPTPNEIRRRGDAATEQMPLEPGMSQEELARTQTQWHLAAERILLEYAQELAGQVRVARQVARLSPASSFSFGAEAASGGGLARFRRFLDNAARFRAQLFEAVLAADREDPESQHRYRPWYCGGNRFSRRRVDVGSAAHFDDAPVPTADALAAALPDAAVLGVYNVLLFLIAFARFMRQDVTTGGA